MQESHHAHEHSGHRVQAASVTLNRLALAATAHCLAGCAIGEVLGLAVTLAFVFGYAFTLQPLLAGAVPFRRALSLALASDTLSITVMEIVDNAVVLVIPGAMDAGLSSLLFWTSLALSLALAFVAAFPVNRWLISQGRGHALVHAHHHE